MTAKLTYLIILLTGISLLRGGVASAYDRDPITPEWQARMLARIHEEALKPPEEALPFLGLTIIQLSAGRSAGRPEVAESLEAAIQALKSIPGHADYFGDPIHSARKVLDDKFASFGEDFNGYKDIGGEINVLNRAQTSGFGVLAYVPTPDSVRVLCSFLYDESGKGRGGTRTGEFVNYAMAARALHKLPFEDKPSKIGADPNSSYTEALVASYREWYEEIKAGQRTFSFIGDPQNYDLNGPVAEKKDGPAPREDKRTAFGTGEEKSAKTAAEENDRSAPSQEEGSSSGKFAVIIACVLAVLLAAWLVFREKNPRPE